MNTNTWVFKVLVGFDLFVCACVWRADDVTISSEIGLAMQRQNPPWWARALNAFLNAIQKGHCQLAIQWDIARAEAALKYLQTKQA